MQCNGIKNLTFTALLHHLLQILYLISEHDDRGSNQGGGSGSGGGNVGGKGGYRNPYHGGGKFRGGGGRGGRNNWDDDRGNRYPDVSVINSCTMILLSMYSHTK